MVDLGYRSLFLPLCLFGEHRWRGRGVVFGDRALGMDLLAEHGADPGDDAARRSRDAAPPSRPRIAAPDRLGRHRLRWSRFWTDLCRPRPRQPARRVQFRGGNRPPACRRAARDRLSRAWGLRGTPADPAACAGPAEHRGAGPAILDLWLRVGGDLVCAARLFDPHTDPMQW